MIFFERQMSCCLVPRGPIGWAEDELKKEANKETNKVLNPLERLSSMVSEYIPAITKLNSDI